MKGGLFGYTPVTHIEMLPKNSRRPLTLDHKIRLKKQLAKAYKSSGISNGKDVVVRNEDAPKRVHQNFKPRPEDKIIRKRQQEEYERNKLREVTKSYFIHFLINYFQTFLGKRCRNQGTSRGSNQKYSTSS